MNPQSPQPPSDDDMPPARRHQDSGMSSWDLVLWRLSQIERTIAEIGAQLAARFDAHDRRLNRIERFVEREEEAKRLALQTASSVNVRWIPLALGLLSLAVAVVAIVAR